MIGTLEDAATALSDYREHRTGNVLSFHGSNRAVYRINGIVYKVDMHDTADNVNVMEYNNMTKMKLREGYRFPQVNLFQIDGESVIAMEYISGTAVCECYCTADEECDDTCAPDDIVSYFDSIGLECGGFNAIVNEDGIWIIDAGC